MMPATRTAAPSASKPWATWSMTPLNVSPDAWAVTEPLSPNPAIPTRSRPWPAGTSPGRDEDERDRALPRGPAPADGVTLRPAGRGRSGPAATPAPRFAPAGAALSSGPGTRSGRSPRTRERSVTRPRASLLNVTGQVHGVDLRLAPLSTRGVSGHYGEPLDPAPEWTGHRSPAHVHDFWLELGSGNSYT